ncbi:hypothetical protein [Oceanobacillus sp. CF4.6]
MIVKQHDKLIEVLKLEALESRIAIYHPKKERVVTDLKKRNWQ